MLVARPPRSSFRLGCKGTALGAAFAIALAALGGAQGRAEEAAGQPGPANASSQFAIHGSNTVGARLMPALVEAYAASVGASAATMASGRAEEVEIKLTNPAGDTLASIGIQSHGSGTAVPGLISGKALIGMASRPIDDKEVQALLQAGLPDLRNPGSEHVVALDGLLVLVHPDSPLSTLTLDQIAGIFSGTIADWSAVGRAPGPIHVFARDDKSGTFDTFNALVLKPRKASLRPDAQRFESNEELSDSVARDPNGIGFAGFAYLRNAKALSIDNDCGLPSAPTAFNVKTEEYPLARRLFLYANALPKGSLAESLLQFALSSAARDAVVAAGFIDQEFELLDKQGQLVRLAEGIPALDSDINPTMLKELASTLKLSSRISTTLQFRMSSTKLDNKSLADIGRLADYIKKLAATDPAKTIILAGFTDSAGNFAVNAALSQARAQEVREAIMRAAGPEIPASKIVARGYSELLPATCNTSLQGRNRNRRVEVWLK